MQFAVTVHTLKEKTTLQVAVDRDELPEGTIFRQTAMMSSAVITKALAFLNDHDFEGRIESVTVEPIMFFVE